MDNKAYKTKDIEEKTVAIVRGLFHGNHYDIDVFLSDNDKTENTDGFIRYKGFQLDVQIKGSKTDGNTKIKTKYLKHVNHQNLIYFYCSNVFNQAKVYYKVFTKKEFAEISLYDNYESYNYSITFNKKASKGKARYILFKPFDIATFTSELKYLYKNNLEVKPAQSFNELIGNKTGNIEFSLIIKKGSNYDEYEIVSASSVVNENGKFINKVYNGSNFSITLGNNTPKKGMLLPIIDIGEKETNINGKSFIVKCKEDATTKKRILEIGEHILTLDIINENKLSCTFTARYNIFTKDVDGLENFVLFITQFTIETILRERLLQDLETSKNFNIWLTGNKLDENITNKIGNRKVLYDVFNEEIDSNFRIVNLIDNINILMIANKETKKYMAIHIIDNIGAKFNDVQIACNYFSFIIYIYMKRSLSFSTLFNIQNIDFRQEIPKYMKLLHPHQDLMDGLILMDIYCYIYSKDEVIYDLLEKYLLDNISDINYFINYTQLKRHKGLKLNIEEEERLRELSTCKDTVIALCANIILANNDSIKVLFRKLPNADKNAFKNWPIFELVDKSVLD